MTTVVVLLALAAYFGGAALFIVRGCQRVDAAFVRDMHRVLRSRGGVGSEEADRSHPQGLSALAGVERGGHPPHAADAPPAPCTSKPTPSSAKSWSSQPLAGAVVPQPAAPVRPPRVMVHG